MASKLHTANLHYVFVQDYLGEHECVVASFMSPSDAFRFMRDENEMFGANGRLYYKGELIPESVVDVTTLHEWQHAYCRADLTGDSGWEGMPEGRVRP